MYGGLTIFTKGEPLKKSSNYRNHINGPLEWLQLHYTKTTM